jgi:hypothetical protein
MKVKLIFPENLVTEPIIWQLGKSFDIVYNIQSANVTADSGWVILELSGRDTEKGLGWLREKGIEVQKL